MPAFNPENSTAVSLAMEEGNSGSKPILKDDCTSIHMVGGTPTVQARLGGVDALSVVDSGSMVSFVTKSSIRRNSSQPAGV